MYPIMIGKNRQGLVGHSIDSFVQEFDAICSDHLNKGRAKSFAFIVYNFYSDLHRLIETQGALLQLNNLSGHHLTIFYFFGSSDKHNSNENRIVANLNEIIKESAKTKGNFNTPFIFFFDFKDNQVTVVDVVHLIQDNPLFIFNELKEVISQRVERIIQQNKTNTPNNNVEISIQKAVNETKLIMYEYFLNKLFDGIHQ